MTKRKKDEPEDKALERLKQFERSREPQPNEDNETEKESEQQETKEESKQNEEDQKSLKPKNQNNE